MAHATPTPRSRQVRCLRQQFAQAPALPFAALLPSDQVEQALRDEPVTFRDRLFSPLSTRPANHVDSGRANRSSPLT